MKNSVAIIRLLIFAEGQVFSLGKDRDEAEEIFNAYFKAVKQKKRCFDLIEYQKEK